MDIAQVFRSKIGSWRKALRQRADFHFVDAPFLVEGDDKDVQLSGGAQEGPRRGWWKWQVRMSPLAMVECTFPVASNRE